MTIFVPPIDVCETKLKGSFERRLHEWEKEVVSIHAICIDMFFAKKECTYDQQVMFWTREEETLAEYITNNVPNPTLSAVVKTALRSALTGVQIRANEREIARFYFTACTISMDCNNQEGPMDTLQLHYDFMDRWGVYLDV